MSFENFRNINSYVDLESLINDFSQMSIHEGMDQFSNIALVTKKLQSPTTQQEKKAKGTIDTKISQFVVQNINSLAKTHFIQVLENSLALNYNLSGTSNETMYTKHISELLKNKAFGDYETFNILLECTVKHKWTHDPEFLDLLLDSLVALKRRLNDNELHTILNKVQLIKNSFDNDLFVNFVRGMTSHLLEAKVTDFKARYLTILILEGVQNKTSELLKKRLFTQIKDDIQIGNFDRIKSLAHLEERAIHNYLLSCLKECTFLPSFFKEVPVEKSLLTAWFHEAQNNKNDHLITLPAVCHAYVCQCKKDKEEVPTEALQTTITFIDSLENFDQQMAPSSCISLLQVCAETQIRNSSLLEKTFRQLVEHFDRLEKDQIIEVLRTVAKLAYNEKSGLEFSEKAKQYLSMNIGDIIFHDSIKSLWAFAILQVPIDKDLVPVVVSLLQRSEHMVVQNMPLSPLLATQLYQICCWIDLVTKKMPAAQKIQTANCKKYIEHTLKPFSKPASSNLHKAVSEAIKSHASEKDMIIKDEFFEAPFFIDIALLQNRIAIDVQGPTHLLSDGTTPPKDQFKNNVLTKRQWKVLYVDHKVWEQCSSIQEKICYLQGLFQKNGFCGIIKL